MMLVRIIGSSVCMERPRPLILLPLRNVVIRACLWIQQIVPQSLHPAFIIFPVQQVQQDPKESRESQVFLAVKVLLETLDFKETRDLKETLDCKDDLV